MVVNLDELFSHAMDYPPAQAEAVSTVGIPPSEGEDQPIADSLPAEPVAEGSPASPTADPLARALPGGGGVYLLTDEHDRIIQLSMAADLRRALLNRLRGDPGDGPASPARRRADLGAIVRRIRWRPAHSMFELDFEHQRIARQIMPPRYLKDIALAPCWFVHVDVEAPFPRFVPGKALRSPPGVDLGPMPTQAAATRLVELLEDAFDLCRYYEVLRQAPHGQRCAYFDMGKCPAPCDGTIGMEAYRASISQALTFAAGERSTALDEWHRQMSAAASELAFERAAALKQRIERTAKLSHEDYRHLRPMDAFRYLVVQRGPGTTWTKAFLVSGGRIEPAAPVRLKDLEGAVESWIERVKGEVAPKTSIGTPAQTLTTDECIRLMGRYLFKKDPPGLFLHGSELLQPDRVCAKIRSRFTAPAKPALQNEIQPVSPPPGG